MRNRVQVDRRTFLRRSIGCASALTIGSPAARTVLAQAPAIVQSDANRPALAQGVAAGAVGVDRAVIWSRTDRAARMFVEYSTTEAFTDPRRIRGPAALESSDFTGRLLLTDLPPGQRIFYRVLFQDLSDLRTWSAPVSGCLVTPATAPASQRDLTLVWSADTVGQGWGINSDWGGLRLYETMSRAHPDLFVHCGDTIYADQVVVPEVKLDDGTIWRNVVRPAKSKPAQSLDDFRGCYQYNLLDEHMRRFNAEVSQVVIWDDHEVHDNWYPARDLSKEETYQEKSMALLAARGRQAFFEYNPLPLQGDDPERVYRTVPFGLLLELFALDMRSYRGSNSTNRQTELDSDSALLGASQVLWLKTRLAASRATWKVIVSDLPIGLVVRDLPSNFEAVANNDPGPPLGRELEIAALLRFIRDRRLRNIVWITADVHYCAAHHYHPSRAKFTEFDPFWEFVAGPLNAGTFGPNDLDPTFGPEVKFNGVAKGMKGNRPPSDGLQFFGKMQIDHRTRALTVSLHDLSGKSLYTVDLAPEAR
jgi:alkaline phosphatase D